MFAFADAPVKVVALLIMFAFCTVWSLNEVVRSRTTVARIGAVLHLIMSLVMVLMVLPVTWVPLRTLVTLPGMVAIFAASTVWFVYRAAVGLPGHRSHAWGHAAMFAAMTWHVSGMFVRHRAMMAAGAMPTTAAHDGGTMASGGAVAVAVIGIPFMLYLLISGLVELVRAVRPVHPEPQTARSATKAYASAKGSADTAPMGGEDTQGHAGCASQKTSTTQQRLGSAAMAAMNLGMFWMSTGLMAPIAPWLDVLTF